MKPPKCRTCGVDEWQHVCGPVKILVTKKAPFVGSILAGSVNRGEGVLMTVPKTVTQTVTQPAKGGRGKRVHNSAADKQRAYRDRTKAKA